MRAVNLGWDMGRPGGGKTVYYCNVHGHMEAPCVCIDAYFKSQVRDARERQITEEENGSIKLYAAIRAGHTKR